MNIKVPLVDDYLTSCIIGGIVTGFDCGLVLKRHMIFEDDAP